MQQLPLSVIHYGANDPEVTAGGVETFARNLRTIFQEVRFMTPARRNFDEVRRLQIPVICDNQNVRHWPKDIPLIGFQNGVAAVKARLVRTPGRLLMAWQQKRAARRPKTIWVACAAWVGRTCGEIYGNPAHHTVYYFVDTARFDGRLDNEGSKLILHDGRTAHKGKHLWPILQKAFPQWRFEGLNCRPQDVPERMRKARAFIHLSRYEGNSLVCNEAMAMNLPCLFTKVGLMQDENRPHDVFVIEPEEAFGNADALVSRTREFLQSLDTRSYNPRAWSLANASPEVAVNGWREAMKSFYAMSGWPPPSCVS